jgi:intein-encoded DNA endonuclease-like protein
MQEIRIRLTEPEAQCLKEMAQQAGISVEEAAQRAIRYVIKEVVSINPQFYQRLRSQMFWDHYRHLNEVLRRNGGGQ